MDHESTRLSDEERRILAGIEQGLKGGRFRFRGLFRRRSRRASPRPGGRARRVWWMGVVMSSCLLLGGLLVGAVWVSAVGFVAVVGSLFVVTADVVPARVVERLRRLIGPGDDAKPR